MLTLEQTLNVVHGKENDPAVLWQFIREQLETLNDASCQALDQLVHVTAGSIEQAASKLIDLRETAKHGH